jgi:hypothetical protein
VNRAQLERLETAPIPLEWRRRIAGLIARAFAG